MKIMIVEDNDNLREAVSRYLELEDYTVFEFDSIKPAERQLSDIHPDLIILDVMLPDGDGFLFARRIKKDRDVPILFVTARTEESDRITGLELGADDYIVKPFSTKELVLRVKAVIKRTMKSDSDEFSAEQYSLDGVILQIFPDQHRILKDDEAVVLTAAEWNILVYLAQKAPQVFSRLQLLQICLESIAEGSERTIDTHIKNIRNKLGDQRWIETVRGFGYRFNGRQA